MLPLWLPLWMTPLWTVVDVWRAKAENFWSGGDKTEIYHRCVWAAINDPETARLLEKRDGVTRDAVFEQMRTSSYHRFAVLRCPSTALDTAVDELDAAQEKHESAAGETEWDWRIACALIAASLTVVLMFGGPLILAAVGLATTVALFCLFWCGSMVWFNLRWSLAAAGLGVSWLIRRAAVGREAAEWGEVLQERGTGPVVAQLVQHMLGDDPESLFIPDRHEGLSAPRDPGYVVENGAARQLQRKLKHIQDGTIAVCGPRGAGKTTLLQQCVDRADFGVLAQAPATYTPHDFLLSLSVSMCRTYMSKSGYPAPEFTRLSPGRRLLRRLRLRGKRLARWSSFAVPAGALLVLGLFASARSLYTQYASSATDRAHAYTDVISDHAVTIWQGHAVVASVIAVIAGIVWWQSRHTAWLPHLLKRMWQWGCKPFGRGLVLLSVVTVLFDNQIRQQVIHLQHTQEEDLARTIFSTVALTLCWLILRLIRDSDRTFFTESSIRLEVVFRPLAAVVGTLLVIFLVRNPQTHALLADPENLLRLAGIVAGILLSRAGGWSPRPEEPALVTQCRNHLYRLQTIQQSTNGMTAGGAAQVLTLGSSHTTSVSTVPPNYPELVEEFRNLLKRIAFEKAVQGKTVVIAIDEVDRLGSDTQALAFLPCRTVRDGEGTLRNTCPRPLRRHFARPAPLWTPDQRSTGQDPKL
ncbi:hypothetical protein [Streptomyces sp. NPDC055210]